MRTFGIDISKYQKGLDLAKAKAEGVEFVILRSGGGDGPGLYKDSTFEGFYSKAVEIGLPVGCYFFANCTDEAGAIKEANYFLSIIKGKTFPMKCWYDIEAKTGNLPKATINAVAKAFCKTVSDAGYECGVYANLSTMNKIDYDGSISASYRKWVACWGSNKPSSVRDSDIWQLSGEKQTIKYNVIAGRVCDLDYCYFDIGNTTPVPKPVEPVSKEYTIEDFRKEVLNILEAKTCEEAFNKTITVSRWANYRCALVTPLERYFKAIGYYSGVIEADKGESPIFGSGMEKATKAYQKNVVKAKLLFQDGILTKKGATWKKLLGIK